MARQNYRQVKKQKEAARKARHVEKLQRRQTKPDELTPEGDVPGGPAAASVDEAAPTPVSGE